MRCLNTKLVSPSNNMSFDDSSQSYANRESIKNVTTLIFNKQEIKPF